MAGSKPGLESVAILGAFPHTRRENGRSDRRRVMTAPPLLELIGITKRFPGVTANDAVSFTVGKGEIHALLGENGAGKSTLVKMIYGVMQPDEGVMRLGGEPYAPDRPSAARARHVGMVFQHFSLFDGAECCGEYFARPERRHSAQDAAPAGDRRLGGLRAEARPGPAGRHAVGRRAPAGGDRALPVAGAEAPHHGRADIGAYSAGGRSCCSRCCGGWRRRACSILYISHKLEEVRALTSRATILRGGKVVASCDPRQESAGRLAEMMIGRPIAPPSRGQIRPGPVRLEVSGLTLASEAPFGVDLHDVSLKVRGRRDPRHCRRGGQRPGRTDGSADRRAASRHLRSDPDRRSPGRH